ncbi:MAG: nucleotidyltransferase family protein [Minwuiales bacterium]|nr:nucleotidyltransferase family protein [Minwuiales bacterium]
MTTPADPSAAPRRYSALVLAGSRGPDDPMTRSLGVAHKCLIDIAGRPMLLRVLEALRASDSVGSIAICIDDAAVLRSVPQIAAWLDAGEVRAVSSDATPSLSVIRAAGEMAEPFPLLITTADSPLLTPEMVDRFCRGAAEGGAQVAAGLAPATVILRDYPTAIRTFLKFRDGWYSGCNLFAMTEPAALEVARFWARTERHRKRPWKLIGAFGLGSLLLFLFRRLTLDDAMRRASRILGVSVAAVTIPVAEAAIDVDKPADLELVREILAARA